jgi:hypothetical protein
MRAAKEYNSRTVPQVTSTLNPNAVPFVSRRSTFSTFMTNEGSGLTSSTQKQAIIKGQKRKLEEDAVFCKARKENEQGEPPRKKHCSISIAESYPRPRTFIQQESSNNVGEKVKESKSSGVEQLLNCKRSPIRVKQASTTGREMRVPLRPITNKAKVQKHNGRVSRNAKKAAIKAAITAVITAEKEAEKMKREEEKRKEQKKRRERSRQIDLEALERRKIRAQQQRMLDKDLVARARFLHEYAERIAYIKKERYMNRTHKKLSPYYHRALYNIYRKLS